mmetsp:Transcript_3399/g.3920  ORF Transcript_3399/g.3920 Transcript_3399/m.3920 type:complete len:92 (+) Transcript_3399:38-313(+)
MTLKKYCEGWGRLRVNKPLPRRATRKNHEPWQVKIIEDFLINVKRHPDAEEKKMLQRKTGLTPVQVKYFCTNFRRRKLPGNKPVRASPAKI